MSADRLPPVTPDELREMADAEGVPHGPARDDPGWPVNGASPEEGAPAPVVLPWHTFREIGESVPERPDWVIQGLLAANAITDITAKIKAGKTSLVLGMVKAIVTGEPFLGFPTQQGRVVILTEERDASLREGLARFGLLDRDDCRVLKRQQLMREYPGLPWDDLVNIAVNDALAFGAKTFVVDTLSDWAGLAGDSENDAGVALAAERPLQAAAERGMAITQTRHDRKAGGDVGDAGRGSSAFAGAVDILLALTRADSSHPNRRIITGLGRFDDVPGEIVVELEDGQYVYVGDKIAVERGKAREAILEYITETPLRVNAIRDLLPLGTAGETTTRSVLKELTREGALIEGREGKAHTFALAPTFSPPVPPETSSFRDQRGRSTFRGVPLTGETLPVKDGTTSAPEREPVGADSDPPQPPPDGDPVAPPLSLPELAADVGKDRPSPVEPELPRRRRGRTVT